MRLAQTNLANKDTVFDNKLKNINRKVTLNKTKGCNETN